MCALILAGKEHVSKILTQSIAKPAVQSSVALLIIDLLFQLCNSGIHTLVWLPQYQPSALNISEMALGIGWCQFRCPIFTNCSASEANQVDYHAIYQKIDYIDSVNPEYVLILSGDHIYKDDWRPIRITMPLDSSCPRRTSKKLAVSVSWIQRCQ